MRWMAPLTSGATTVMIGAATSHDGIHAWNQRAPSLGSDNPTAETVEMPETMHVIMQVTTTANRMGAAQRGTKGVTV